MSIYYKTVNALNKSYYYVEELLEFTDEVENINVSEVLFESEYKIIKQVGNITYEIEKEQFVKELHLPYTEFNIVKSNKEKRDMYFNGYTPIKHFNTNADDIAIGVAKEGNLYVSADGNIDNLKY